MAWHARPGPGRSGILTDQAGALKQPQVVLMHSSLSAVLVCVMQCVGHVCVRT